MQKLMSVMWDSSADVICIYAFEQERVTALLSPSFVNLVGAELPAELQDRRGVAIHLVIERSALPHVSRTLKNIGVKSAKYVDR
jgi:hypothetical protein